MLSEHRMISDFDNPNIRKLSDIASADEVDVTVSLRVIANTLISMEVHTLRGLRERMASLDKQQLEFIEQFKEFKADVEVNRKKREEAEITQAQAVLERNGFSTSKVKAIIDKSKFDWGAWFRDKVLPGVTTAILSAVVIAIVMFVLNGTFGK